ncbi:MAG: tol-pal system protein YbgF [Blastocatellia bacterium]|nr:tol-pal system protein YbgF [Blastocatellia bacterium]
MKSKLGSIMVMGVLFLAVFGTPGASGQKITEKDLKIAIDELKNEVVVLSRQVQTMQDNMNRHSGQLDALITQIIDNVSAIRQAQSRVSEASNSAISGVNGVTAQLSSTNRQIDRLSEQLAELKKMVENLPKLPAFSEVNPGNPEQLFAAAYADYSRGNYDLAISEFTQYYETYPSSEMADNARYWKGECLLAKRLYHQAIAEFDIVIRDFSKGDKVPAARFKKGMALLEIGDQEAARAEFLLIIKHHATSTEAGLARQQLNAQ